ncbi:MAG: oligosaccharide flippase family protein [Ignavibacteriaceae bacterium]
MNKFFQNFLFISGGQIISIVLNFTALTLVARFLGVDDYGQFNYVLAIAVILSKLVDFGLSPITYRESSQSSQFVYLNNAITFRFILFFSVLLLFNLFTIIIRLPLTETTLTNILFINIIISSKFQNVRELLDIPFKVKIISRYSIYCMIIDNVLFLTFVLFIPIYNLGLLFVVLAYVVSNLPGFILIIYFLRNKCGFRYNFDFSKISFLVRESLPLMGYVALITVYQQFDILILKNMDSNYSAGIFSAAARLTLPFNIIPSAIISTIFPLVVSNAKNPYKPKSLNKLIYKVLFFISFLIAITAVFKAKQIIILIFGIEYQEAYIPFIYLFFSQIFLFYNFFTVDLLTAYKKQTLSFQYSFLLVFLNIGLAFILIPKFSFNGAGFAKLLSIICGFLFLFYSAKKLKVSSNFFNLRIMLSILLITTSMFLISNLAIEYYFIISLIIICLITVKLKFFDDSEMITIFKMINKEKWAHKIINL